MIERYDTDILILGAGGAGLLAAIHSARAAPDKKITLVVKGLMGKCGCTRMVQGGYNVAVGDGDSIERHFMDTIVGGKWLSNQELAWKLCENAVVRVRELENEYGCFFDRNADGTLHQKAFAGQTFDRTVHKGDLTGIEIMNRLMEQVRALPVQILEDHRAVSLLPDKNGEILAGALLIDIRSGQFRLVRAHATLLGTGGGPTMYRYHTPSGDKSMDGLAMAHRLGMPLRDMEMVQFHPTGLLAGRDTRMTGTVLEEGLRGAGGHLLNKNGERFMLDHDEAGERATRDVVSRGIYAEMQSTRATENGGVYLSMSHLGAANVARKFKGMVKRCADCGFDLAGDKVEVVPTAHYFMGGVVCDPHTRAEMPGLYVAGEDAGGVHGANRLGGNGVANSTVYGGIAGDVMADETKNRSYFGDIDDEFVSNEVRRATHPFRVAEGNIFSVSERLSDVMWEYAGVIRSEEGLRKGREMVEAIKIELLDVGVGNDGREYNLAWNDWLNLRSLIETSEIIIDAALLREYSRGAHYREDHPTTDDLESSYFTESRQLNGKTTVNKRPVDFSLVSPGNSLINEEHATEEQSI